MDLHIVIDPGQPRGEQLLRQLRSLIRSGRLAADTQLPPTRLLAEQLGLARQTVAEAYERLALEQLIDARRGRGSFVRALPAPADDTPPPAAPPPRLASVERITAFQALPLPFLRMAGSPLARYDFVGGSPEPALFPHADWRRHLHAAQRQLGQGGAHAPPAGLAGLREAIAEHVAFARGVRCSAADVIVTQGAQQAFDLLVRVLAGPGDVAALESPGYPPLLAMLQAQGARAAHVPVDGEGLVTDALPADARLVYTTPAHQFPLGVAMSASRRQALLAWASRSGAVVIEDDYDSEFRFEGQPRDSLQGLDAEGRVAFVGSFSKTLAPSLRLGYVVTPPGLPALREALLNAKHLADVHGPSLLQNALARFMAEGAYRKHLRRCVAEYAQRRERLMAGFGTRLAPWLTLLPAEAGFHQAALLKPGLAVDATRLAALARRVDVGLYPLQRFGAALDGLLMGFGRIAPDDIATALGRMGELLEAAA
ncbi:MocR-like pyridoxine biosynthesis transcription factor PdxR [Pelomonas aquatica]|jgi:GntR family transcriptional regulator/MocR family aminotransferase|uniref:PLP-dependent aminotransferase family protein n=1 Tax=Pelomonas aquatica TaxID=431058 RepID=A0A9X4LK43_9BURK|nr:PLP-dependent aminotransferase family protein [Pelomonas aquatica]MCY4753659.1 PLP-dependent aminotransferase family protein [Pelomonas aquatica]MDG0864997.1 PLP-dependent aminotransferase family protein [Pelomonas aquatica]